MVRHDISVQGVDLKGVPQNRPALLQMNDDDFPKAFLRDLAAIPLPPSLAPKPDPFVMNVAPQPAQLSSTQSLPIAGSSTPITLYQPVTRVTHLVMVQLCCESPGYPRVDPKRVLSAGLVIRRVPLAGGPAIADSAWMRNPQGQFGWVPRVVSQSDDDPDPTRRPQLQSGRPELDQLLAAQALATALTESTTPAFVAAPDICNAAQRTLVYAVIPTASSEASTLQAPSVSPLDGDTISQILPTLLQAGSHVAPQADNCVDYHYMSDEYAKSKNASDFIVFSTTLRMLYTVFDAFDPKNPQAQALFALLNQFSVTMKDGCTTPMGDFYQEAATALIDYDPQSGQRVPSLQMPHAWHCFTGPEETELLNVMAPLLRSQGTTSSTPEGRFQDSTRLYRARLFFRIKSENPQCPPELVWSCFSDPFRIGAWYESAGRAVAPIPLPDPFDKNALSSAKPTAAFAVPARLMNAMNSASLTNLMNGQAPSGGGVGLGWICSFSIPIITICAFFVLNIFLSLLNIVFFWMAFIKICIPIPVPKSNNP